MKVIIKDGKVFSSHKNNVDITGLYEDVECLIVPEGLKDILDLTKQEVLDLLSDDEKKQVQLNASKETRNMELEANVVKFGEYDVWAAPAAFSNLQMLHDSMGDEDTEEIYQDLEIIPVTKADLSMILAVGTAQGKIIHDAHKERVRSL